MIWGFLRININLEVFNSPMKSGCFIFLRVYTIPLKKIYRCSNWLWSQNLFTGFHFLMRKSNAAFLLFVPVGFSLYSLNINIAVLLSVYFISENIMIVSTKGLSDLYHHKNNFPYAVGYGSDYKETSPYRCCPQSFRPLWVNAGLPVLLINENIPNFLLMIPCRHLASATSRNN